jgi:AraC-like DNA-binding protein
MDTSCGVSVLTGMSPHKYIASKRLEFARAQTFDSTGLLTEIAFHCGFASGNHMASAFRKHFTISLSELT